MVCQPPSILIRDRDARANLPLIEISLHRRESILIGSRLPERLRTETECEETCTTTRSEETSSTIARRPICGPWVAFEAHHLGRAPSRPSGRAGGASRL